MVRLRKAKRRHTTNQDFKKKSNKIGKSKRAENATNTTITSKGIYIAQSFTNRGKKKSGGFGVDDVDEVDVEMREAMEVIQDLAAKVSHHNGSVRQDAVQGLVLAVKTTPRVLGNSSVLLKLIDRVFPRISDSERNVRFAMKDLFTIIAEEMDENALTPYFSLLLAHTVNAMTNIRNEVRTFALDIVDIWLENTPRLLVSSGADVLRGFLQLITTADAAQAASTSTVSRIAGGPKSKLSSRAGRLRVMEGLDAFLNVLLQDRTASSNNGILFGMGEGVHTKTYDTDSEEDSDDDDDDNDESPFGAFGSFTKEGGDVNEEGTGLFSSIEGWDVASFLPSLDVDKVTITSSSSALTPSSSKLQTDTLDITTNSAMLSLNSASDLYLFTTNKLWPILHQVWLETISTNDELLGVSLDSKAKTINAAITIANLASTCMTSLFLQSKSHLDESWVDSLLAPLQTLLFDHFPFGGNSWPLHPLITELNIIVAQILAVACVWKQDKSWIQELNQFLATFLVSLQETHPKNKVFSSKQEVNTTLQIIVHLSKHQLIDGEVLPLLLKVYSKADKLSQEKRLIFAVMKDVLEWCANPFDASISAEFQSLCMNECLAWINTFPRLLWELNNSDVDFSYDILSVCHQAFAENIFQGESVTKYSLMLQRFMLSEGKGKVLLGPFARMDQQTQDLYLDTLYYLPATTSAIQALHKASLLSTYSVPTISRIYSLISQKCQSLGMNVNKAIWGCLLKYPILILEPCEKKSDEDNSDKENENDDVVNVEKRQAFSLPLCYGDISSFEVKQKVFQSKLYNEMPSQLDEIKRMLEIVESVEGEFEGDCAQVCKDLEEVLFIMNGENKPIALDGVLTVLKFLLEQRSISSDNYVCSGIIPFVVKALACHNTHDICSKLSLVDLMFYDFLRKDDHLLQFLQQLNYEDDNHNMLVSEGEDKVSVLKWLSLTKHADLYAFVKANNALVQSVFTSLSMEDQSKIVQRLETLDWVVREGR